jgi:(p)ppGpp synthase/HD superfamily hydrolase
MEQKIKGNNIISIERKQDKYDDLNFALLFAINCHIKQPRKDNVTPYIVHPLGVAALMRKFVKEPIEDVSVMELIIACYLHDVIEDCNVTYDNLTLLFGKKIADIVLEVTNDPKEKNRLGKDEYLKQKMCKMSLPALAVKLCDRLDNLQDLKGLDKTAQNELRRRSNNILQDVRQARFHTIPPTLHDIFDALNVEILKSCDRYHSRN